jgi:hypothetical protein
MKRHLLSLGLLAGLALAACKNDSTNPSVTLVFVGTVQGSSGSLSGQINLTVTGTTASGTFKIVSPTASTHALSGTYNTGTKAVAAAGDGYTFGGVYDGTSQMSGTMSGAASGTFVASKDDNSTAVAFCGSYTGSDAGAWSFTVVGTSLAGSATSSGDGHVTSLSGTMSGNTITVALPGGGGNLASGTRTGNSVSGTWDNHSGSTGNWTGARCN